MCFNPAERTRGSAAWLLVVLLCLPSVLRAQSSDSLKQADGLFVRAFAEHNRDSLGALLDTRFIWIGSNGRRLSRAQVVQGLPALANSETGIQVREYGYVAVVRANRGRMSVLRVWAKHTGVWRAVLYQEVMQVEKSESPVGTTTEECINPCKTIPFQPETQSEKEAIASWQGVMKAMSENDTDAYAPLIAEEFTATDTYHDRPYTKADRLAQINKQKERGKRSSPPELVSAEMFDFGGTVMMVAREQRPGAKSYFNTRMWADRGGRWQMLFSFNTQIE